MELTGPALWDEAKLALDAAARAYLAGAPDAREQAERALALMRRAESESDSQTAVTQAPATSVTYAMEV